MSQLFAAVRFHQAAAHQAASIAGLVVVVALAVLLGPASVANAATITVTTSGDDLTPNDGSVSLREAITAINAGNDLGDPDITAQNPGLFGANDTINFNIAGAGVKTISVGTDPSAATLPLPTITSPVTINGYTQPGSSVNTLANGDNAVLLIELNGTSAPGHGLTIDAANTTVRGLVINRFTNAGIRINAGGSSATIAGNFLGTNPAGTAALANANGIDNTGAPSVTLGGTALADRNVLSGNSINGIVVTGAGATNLLIRGNFIGTNAAGTGALGNGFAGINILGSKGVTIGGTVAGARNVIAGNVSVGLQVVDVGGGNDGANAVIQGNFFGIGADGVTALGNGVGIGIEGSPNATVGGTTAGAANLIAFNTTLGVRVTAGTSNPIRANSIFSNGGLGIDLGNDGVTPNDTGDPDSGPNNLQNFPVLTSAAVTGGTTHVSGTLNSTASTTFLIDLYSNPACDLPSNYGEGRIYLGTVTAITNASGNASFATTALPAVAPGSVITATATDAANNTSEFSTCQALVTPAVLVSPSAVAATEGGATGSFTVALNSVPVNAVTITLGFDTSQLSMAQTALTFQPDATAVNPQTVTVTAIDDSVVEGTQTLPISFTVSSSDAAFNGASVTPVTATITDNDGPAVLSVADVIIPEGTGSPTSTSFVVTLNPASAQVVTVQYTTVAGTATGGSSCTTGVDYQTATGTLTFNPGETSKIVTVPICGDSVAEPNETFTVALSNPTGGAVLGRGQATGLIDDDDTPQACTPRPRVQTRAVPGGGKLQVAIEPTALNTDQNNRLVSIRFTQLQNARVTVNGQVVVAGQTITAPANTVELDFTLERVTAGQPTMVFFTVIDSCGEWQTFVGGGTAAGF